MYHRGKYSFACTTLFLFVATLTPDCACEPREGCFLSLNRVVGRVNGYNWACACKSTLSVGFEGFGLAQVPALPPEQDTLGRGNAIARCARDNTPHLTRICARNSTKYEIRARRIIFRCFATPLTPRERVQTMLFTYKKDRCRAIFVRLNTEAGRVSGSWLCECLQRGEFPGGYDVISGIAEFFTKGSPNRALAEWKELNACTGEAQTQLEEVCKTSPGDFEILALHLLQTCCKRARVLSESKFRCRAVVPDDLSGLKVANNELP